MSRRTTSRPLQNGAGGIQDCMGPGCNSNRSCLCSDSSLRRFPRLAEKAAYDEESYSYTARDYSFTAGSSNPRATQELNRRNAALAVGSLTLAVAKQSKSSSQHWRQHVGFSRPTSSPGQRRRDIDSDEEEEVPWIVRCRVVLGRDLSGARS